MKARDAEGSMIKDLIASEDDYAGVDGHLHYLEHLAPFDDSSREVDAVLEHDWQASRERLKRLRDVARRHLWKPLHTEWIPELTERGQVFLHEFRRRVATALALRHFADLFNMDTRLVATSVGSTIAGIAAHVQGEINPLHGALGLWLAVLANKRLVEAADRYGALALFYQEAFEAKEA